MTNDSTTRQSNIELLRIVAMSMIVIHHILIYCFQKEITGFYFLNSFVIGGVNIFTLISGYFGIKLKWKSIINLISISLFYSILSLIAVVLIYKEPITLSIILTSFFPIDTEAYWYITYYFFLMLFSPIINAGLNNLTNSQLVFFMGALIFINCFSGWIFQNNINPKGYTTMQLLFMYCVGYIIRLYDTSKNLKIRDLISGGVISYIIIATIAPHAWRLFYYNNPILIIFSLCIFLSFLKIQFTNRLINNFAKSMLAVYLLQEGLLGRRIYDIIYNIQSSTNTSKTIAIIGAYFIGLFTFAVLLEWIRFHLFNHLNNSLGNFLEKRLNISQ